MHGPRSSNLQRNHIGVRCFHVSVGLCACLSASMWLCTAAAAALNCGAFARPVLSSFSMRQRASRAAGRASERTTSDISERPRQHS